MCSRPGRTHDARFATNPERPAHDDELTAIIEQALSGACGPDEVAALLDEAGIANARGCARRLSSPLIPSSRRVTGGARSAPPAGPVRALLPPVTRLRTGRLRWVTSRTGQRPAHRCHPRRTRAAPGSGRARLTSFLVPLFPGLAVARMWLLSAACDVYLSARAAGPVTAAERPRKSRPGGRSVPSFCRGCGSISGAGSIYGPRGYDDPGGFRWRRRNRRRHDRGTRLGTTRHRHR